MRRLAPCLSGLCALLTLSGSALAVGECPEGDWFCEPAPAPSAPPARPEAPERGDGDAARGTGPKGDGESEQELSARERRQIELDVEGPRPAVRRRPRRFREWGVNLHVDGGLMGGDSARASDSSMNGFGAALRFRPIPHIAIEGSLELLWGTDFNGFERLENALLVNALVFVNPRSAIQFYGLGGVGFGAAFVRLEPLAGAGYRAARDETYSYFGGQLGLGVEARITRHFAIGGDLLGFIRRRTDRFARQEPEFVDPVTHRASNVSGGGMLRGGATFYW